MIPNCENCRSAQVIETRKRDSETVKYDCRACGYHWTKGETQNGRVYL